MKLKFDKLEKHILRFLKDEKIYHKIFIKYKDKSNGIYFTMNNPIICIANFMQWEDTEEGREFYFNKQLDLFDNLINLLSKKDERIIEKYDYVKGKMTNNISWAKSYSNSFGYARDKALNINNKFYHINNEDS